MGYRNLKAHCKTLKRLIDLGKNVAIYCFDTWETQYQIWDDLFSFINPTVLFLAYKQSCIYFSKRYQNVVWLPQSMDTSFFRDYGEGKTRLFMQMGRRNERIHEMILEYLKTNRIEDIEKNYIYEKTKGDIIFPKTEELAKEINKTKYFVCAPQLLENSRLTGNVSDVTARYYEALASKSMIIGYKPSTFDELFPDIIIIDLDKISLKDAVDFYETNPKEYMSIVNKNYDSIMADHTWKSRFEMVKQKYYTS